MRENCSPYLESSKKILLWCSVLFLREGTNRDLAWKAIGKAGTEQLPSWDAEETLHESSGTANKQRKSTSHACRRKTWLLRQVRGWLRDGQEHVAAPTRCCRPGPREVGAATQSFPWLNVRTTSAGALHK